MSHLVIVDGHAIAHRAYHSIPPLSVNGQPVNALYGFYSMILSAIDILKPKYLIVCLDSPGPNFRNTEFVGYRAKRKPTDYDLVSQLPLLHTTLETAKIPHLSMGGFEADDLIATVARRSLKIKDKKTKKPLVSKITIITGDKDLMQLVDNKISLFVPIRGLSETKLYGPTEVQEKLGVDPHQVIDLKALMGDMSDNYPGVAGIGPKTAIDLLQKYIHLNNIYSHIDEINDSVKLKLVKDRDNAYLSQKLATLVANVPLKFTLNASKFNDVQINGLETLFQEYNFKSLMSRLHKNFNKKVTKPKSVVDSNQGSLF